MTSSHRAGGLFTPVSFPDKRTVRRGFMCKSIRDLKYYSVHSFPWRFRKCKFHVTVEQAVTGFKFWVNSWVWETTTFTLSRVTALVAEVVTSRRCFCQPTRTNTPTRHDVRAATPLIILIYEGCPWRRRARRLLPSDRARFSQSRR